METKTTCKLKTLIYNKVKHLLSLYPKTEWSGLAFYKKIKPNKLGWTNEWELVDFFPIDLGSSAATEFSGEQEMDMMDKVYKENPKLRECYRGLIHSHHSLSGGAFFSGTDRNHMKECANKVGYPSLVVAHDSTGSPWAFSWSYVDQFGLIHWTEEEDGSVIIDCDNMKPKGLFEECLLSLNKQEKESTKIVTNGFSLNSSGFGYQSNLFGYKQEVQPVRQPSWPYPESIDNKKLNKKYQKLLSIFMKSDKLWMLVDCSDSNFDEIRQSATVAERNLDAFCEKHSIETNDVYQNSIGGI